MPIYIPQETYNHISAEFLSLILINTTCLYFRPSELDLSQLEPKYFRHKRAGSNHICHPPCDEKKTRHINKHNIYIMARENINKRGEEVVDYWAEIN